MTQLRLNLLGEFQVRLDGQPVQLFGTQKARALLAYLMMESSQAHSREHLACLLWPDQPEERARHSLRQALSALRSVLGESDDSSGFLLIERESVRFNPDSDLIVDAGALLAEAEAIKRHAHRQRETCLACLKRSRRISELYRADFLAGFNPGSAEGFNEWAALRREWLHEQAIEALAHLVAYHERRGEWAGALGFARRIAQMEPWREETHQQLMRLLATSGQRSAALRQFEICRKALQHELGIEPSQATRQLYAQIQRSEASPASASRPALPVAPALCLGRETELNELAELLASPPVRLVSIVGPGGVGKTRLALACASEQDGLFPDGVAWVSAQDIPSGNGASARLALALGISEAALGPGRQTAIFESADPWTAMLEALKNHNLLLVLDNLEHLETAPGLVDEILRRLPGVIVLATSRQRLALHQEWVFELHGLDYYPAGQHPANWQDSPAVALYTHSARRVQRQFKLDENQAESVLRICALVEGLPLAIELAAAWASSRPANEIAAALEAHAGILTSNLNNLPERQRSAHSSFDVSWRLLGPSEQEALMGLSIFRGGFDIAAAQAIAGAGQAGLVHAVCQCALASQRLAKQVLRSWAAGAGFADRAK